MSCFKVSGIVLACLAVIPAAVLASSVVTDQTFVKQFHPRLQAHLASGEIKVDGRLNDAGWRGAEPATNFSEHSPGQEVAPPVRTEAFVAYDENNLYLAAICWTDPATVRASMCERERIFDDDNIGFFFDTFGDGSRAYIININPYGIPYDALWSAGWGEDSNFDLIFESAGIVTDSGYQVELAIPFANLRFPSRDVQEWKFDFYRHHLREVHYSMSWATYDTDDPCWPCQWGTVTGIENVKPGKGIELLPSFVAHQSGSVTNATYPDTSFANGDIYGDLSIGGKYAISSDAVVEATYNPDFSQIEADASQVDVNTTFALSYDERRPFFQEGIDVFRTNFNAVYTRSINDPDFAAKASAKLGSLNIAAMSAHDERSWGILPFEERSAYIPLGKTYVNMAAARYAFGNDNHVRAVVTDQRIDGGGSGTLASADGSVSLTKSLSIRGQVMATHTEEPDDSTLTAGLEDLTFDDDTKTAVFDGESYWGSAVLGGFAFADRRFYAYVRGYQRTPTYRAASGFQPQNGDRRVIGNFSYEYRPSGTIFHELYSTMEVCRLWNFDGIRKDEWIKIGTSGYFRFAQSDIWVEYLRSRERLGGVDFDGIWGIVGGADVSPSRVIEGGFSFSYGDKIARRYLEMGQETSVGAWLDIQPTDRLLLETDFDYTVSRRADTDFTFFEGYILRHYLGYQFSREFSLRLVSEYNDFQKRWSIDPLITYRINAFSTFFAGSSYDYDKFYCCGVEQEDTMTCLSQRQFFVKIQYLFQT